MVDAQHSRMDVSPHRLLGLFYRRFMRVDLAHSRANRVKLGRRAWDQRPLKL